MRPSQLLAAVVALSSLGAAWPDVFDNANALADVKNVIYGRQENDDSAKPSATEAPKTSAADDDEKPQSTNDSKETDQPSATEKETGKTTGKPTGTQKQSATNSKSKDYGNGFAGGITMVTPAPIAGPQYYKIGEWVTFAWNYTALSETPKNVDILATCTANQATYTLAVNHSAQETEVLWDTEGYQASASIPLLTESYTLIIYDSNADVSAAPAAGYLAPYSQHVFGMYTPQPYVKWEDFNCANCVKNSALSASETLTLRVLLITTGTTIASLLYFAFSFGVL